MLSALSLKSKESLLAIWRLNPTTSSEYSCIFMKIISWYSIGTLVWVGIIPGSAVQHHTAPIEPPVANAAVLPLIVPGF